MPHTITIDRNAPVQATAQLVIAAPPGLVWDVLADIGAWKDWNGDVSRAELHGDLTPGASFSWKAGGMAIESILLATERPGMLGWSGRTMGIQAVHLSRFHEQGAGTLAVTEESFAGFLPWLLRGPMRRMLQRSLLNGLEALRQECERRAAASPSR